MLHLYAIGKIELGSRPEPSSILTTAEKENFFSAVCSRNEPHWLWVYEATSPRHGASYYQRMVVPILLPKIGQVKNGRSYLTSDIQYFR